MDFPAVFNMTIKMNTHFWSFFWFVTDSWIWQEVGEQVKFCWSLNIPLVVSNYFM